MPLVKDGLPLWQTIISEFSISLEKTNIEADALSRIPRDGHTKLDKPTVKAIMSAIPYTD